MASIYASQPPAGQQTSHVTIRRGQDGRRSKMAEAEHGSRHDPGHSSSILIDSILSQDESKDVLSMMIMANEHTGYSGLPSFCTSTQMGGRNQYRRPYSPPLSPLRTARPEDGGRPEERHAATLKDIGGSPTLTSKKLSESVINPQNFNREVKVNDSIPEAGTMPKAHEVGATPNSVSARNEFNVSDLLSPPGGDGAITMGTNQVTNDVNEDDAAEAQVVGDEAEAHGDDVREEPTPLSTDADLATVIAKIQLVDDILLHLDEESTKMHSSVRDLTTSLEFSQSEIDALKKENADMKKKLDEVLTEDKRTQFQVNTLEDKLDKVESMSKKKNLLFEGIPEVEDRREDVGKAICSLFDQLSVNKNISFDACYRVGTYVRSRTRPILVSFERQLDRDLVYRKRMDLRKTTDFQKVWVNEDLSPISQRKRGLIRLITKEAQQQGIDCKTGKYSIQIKRTKYDSSNMEDLPPQLHPSQLKQVQIDQNTIAYQSEYAPFSNFFPSRINIGRHEFFCLEQAFQFMKAKTLNKPLAATKIFLSRDVRFIKQLGAELGSSDEWETKQFDIMYECLKRKFEQNQDLKALLLKSGDLQLVEATPDLLWGCGATLSSNVLRRHKWAGKNKQGEILMVVREELRHAAETTED